MNNDTDLTFDMGDDKFTWSDLGSLDMETVPEYRFEQLPEGIFLFRVTKTERESIQTEKGNMPIFKFTSEVLRVLQVKDANVNQDDLVGKEHTETIWLSEVVKGIGLLKAFLSDTGAKCSGTVLQIMDTGMIGHEYVGTIRKRRNRNDPDNPFIGLNYRKVAPATEVAAAAA